MCLVRLSDSAIFTWKYSENSRQSTVVEQEWKRKKHVRKQNHMQSAQEIREYIWKGSIRVHTTKYGSKYYVFLPSISWSLPSRASWRMGVDLVCLLFFFGTKTLAMRIWHNRVERRNQTEKKRHEERHISSNTVRSSINAPPPTSTEPGKIAFCVFCLFDFGIWNIYGYWVWAACCVLNNMSWVHVESVYNGKT